MCPPAVQLDRFVCGPAPYPKASSAICRMLQWLFCPTGCSLLAEPEWEEEKRKGKEGGRKEGEKERERERERERGGGGGGEGEKERIKKERERERWE